MTALESPAPYYQDDHVTLYHGDCLTEHREWLAADVLVTDPPYGIGYQTGKFSNATVAKKIKIASDETVTARDDVLALWSGPAMIFGSWKMPRPENVRQRLIWYKAATKPGMRPAPWFAADEEVYVIGDGFTGTPAQNVFVSHESRDGASGEVAKIGHPTPKPILLMEWLVQRTPPGVIADPFAGSGSTLLAAKNLGRQVIGVELEERYCEIIAKRCAQDVFDFGALG